MRLIRVSSLFLLKKPCVVHKDIVCCFFRGEFFECGDGRDRSCDVCWLAWYSNNGRLVGSVCFGEKLRKWGLLDDSLVVS